MKKFNVIPIVLSLFGTVELALLAWHYFYYNLNIFDKPEIDCEINRQKNIRLDYYETENNVCFSYAIGATSDSQELVYVHLSNADKKTFNRINGRYAKDIKNVYSVLDPRINRLSAPTIQIVIIKGADPQTFEVLDGFWAKDKDSIFYKHREISEIDMETFELLDNLRIRDKNYIFEINPSKISDEFEVLKKNNE